MKSQIVLVGLGMMASAVSFAGERCEGRNPHPRVDVCCDGEWVPASSCGSSLQEQNSANGYTTSYSCFNRAQLTDAPMVSIVEDDQNQKFVKTEENGQEEFKKLTFVRGGTGTTQYAGEGVSVSIAERGDNASVTLKDLGIIYACKAAN